LCREKAVQDRLSAQLKCVHARGVRFAGCRPDSHPGLPAGWVRGQAKHAAIPELFGSTEELAVQNGQLDRAAEAINVSCVDDEGGAW
jgi:hypothetical protein